MAAKTPSVVVIGATYTELVIKCEQIPLPGESLEGNGLTYNITGPGLNQAVQIARCGCGVKLVSKLGGDANGHMIRDTLKPFDIDTEHLYTDEVRNTGVIITIVDAEGENASCLCNGANNALSPADIDRAEQSLCDADICLIHGRLPQDTVCKAIQTAKLHGTRVILNPAMPIDKHGQSISPLPDQYFGVDILVSNLYEAAEITEHSDTNIHAAKLIGSDLVARGVGAAVITMNKRGCMVVDRNGADHISAFEVKLVDQTCTGDSFSGALAAYSAVRDDVRGAVKFACAAGALACTKFGTIDALPSRADIIELLQKEDIE